MKLKSLINERWEEIWQPEDDTDVNEYIDDFHELIINKLKFIGKWKSIYDSSSGVIEWVKPNGLILLATPFWELKPEIPLNLIDINGNELLDSKVKFTPTYDKNKDLNRYKTIISKKLKSLDRHLTK